MGLLDFRQGGVSVGGGASDVTIGELAIVQAVNAQSMQYGWTLIDTAAALAASLDRLYGVTVSGGTMADLAASSADVDAVLANSDATAALSVDSTFRSAVVGSSAAMSAIAASETNLRAVLGAPLLFGSIMMDATARGTFTGSTALSAATIQDHNSGADTKSGVGQVKVSSIQATSNGASYAVDGNTSGTYWVPNTQPAWIEYEFDNECAIHTASWHRGTFPANKAETGRLQVYLNGSWVDVVDMPVSGSGIETVYLPATYASTRWRINNISRSNNVPIVSDFRLVGFYV